MAALLFSVAGPTLRIDVFAEPPVLNHFFPAGGQRGQTTQITADGSFPNWPANIWVSSEHITVKAAAEEGQLIVTVADSAVPGQYWIRLHDASGASRLRPFVVDSVAELLESETTDRVVELSQPKIINGVLSANNEVDSYRINLQPGELLVASLTAHRLLGSPMDAVMQLYDVDHQVVLAQIDDAPGRDPRIVFPSPDSDQATISHSGNLAIRLFAFPETATGRIGFAGAKSFIYRLTLSKTGFVDYAVPLTITPAQMDDLRLVGWGLPNEDAIGQEVRLVDNAYTVTAFRDDAPGFGIVEVQSALSVMESTDSARDTPLDCTIPCVVTGYLDRVGDQDAFRFSAQQDVPLRVSVAGRKLDFPTDAVLEIFDTSGKRLHKTDDNDGLDCGLDFKPPATADYVAVVRDLYGHGGGRHRYRFMVTPLEPTYRLEVDSEIYLGTANEEQKITVKVRRENGFDDDIHVAAVGLPHSVVTATVNSQPEGGSAKRVELTLKPLAGCSASFQIVGLSRMSNRVVRAETSTMVAAHRTTDLWLTAIVPEPPADKTP